MHKFYFNECLPEEFSGSLQEVFEKSIYGFNQLIKDNPDIEKGIITHKMPSEVSICDQTIASLIKSIGDPTLRRIAYSYFIKYPIDSLYEVDDIFDLENFDVIYQFNKCSAFHLVIAHKMDWFLYSLPLDDKFCNDQLTIQADTVDDIEIHNWYGANSTYIAQEVRNRRTLFLSSQLKSCTDDKVETILKCLFPKHTYAPEAIDDIIYWKNTDNLLLDKILVLLTDIEIHTFTGGLGQTEVLKRKSGIASKRINSDHRVQYFMYGDKEVKVTRCKEHYD